QQQRRPRLVDGTVAGGVGARVRLMEIAHAHARGPRKRRDHRPCVVRRPVVGHDDLEEVVAAVLSRERLETLGEHRRAVVGRHDHAQPGHGHVVSRLEWTSRGRRIGRTIGHITMWLSGTSSATRTVSILTSFPTRTGPSTAARAPMVTRSPILGAASSGPPSEVSKGPHTASEYNVSPRPARPQKLTPAGCGS